MHEDQFERSNKRVVRLEHDARTIVSQLSRSAHEQEMKIKDQIAQKNDIETHINDVKHAMKRLEEQIRHEMTQFKELVKLDHVKRLEKRVDEWKLEEFISKKEFVALLKSEIS